MLHQIDDHVTLNDSFRIVGNAGNKGWSESVMSGDIFIGRVTNDGGVVSDYDGEHYDLYVYAGPDYRDKKSTDPVYGAFFRDEGVHRYFNNLYAARVFIASYFLSKLFSTER